MLTAPLSLLQFFVFILILLVIGCIAGIFIFRFAATGKWKEFFTINGTEIGGPVASTINAVQIMILNNLYSGMAAKLNDFGTVFLPSLYHF